jgi:uncharacterized protein
MREIDIYNWTDIDDICHRLAAQIREPFDVIVCVLRGGAVPGVILANELGIERVIAMKVVQSGQANVSPGTGAAYEAQKSAVLVPLNDVTLHGRRVLVVDDVLDSGESARVVLEEVYRRGAEVVKLAVMQKKSYSKIEPDYFVEVKTNWLFYPWMSSAELADMRRRLAECEAATAG